jgi:hypothetical protein
MLVLENLNDKELKQVLASAKSGWIDRLKFLDQRLAEQGET